MSVAAEPMRSYTGQKIRRIRWLPRQPDELDESSVFVTGSYDDEVNSLSLWNYNQQSDPNTDSIMNEEEEQNQDQDGSLSFVEPKSVYTRNISGSVMDMEFIDKDKLGVCLSNGSFTVMQYWPRQELDLLFNMESLHPSSLVGQDCSCNCLAVNQFTPNSVFTGGEDGNICVVSTDHGNLVHKIGEDDTTSINAMVCISHCEVLAGYSSAQLKLWDTRSNPQQPSRTMLLSKDVTSSQSLDRHPSQPHLVVAGCSNGHVCFWDLRQEKQPINILEAHSSEVWEVGFHSLYPNYLFSCSQDGSLWQWNSSSTNPGLSETIFNSSTMATLGGHVPMDTQQSLQTANWLSTPSLGLEVCSVLSGDSNLSVNSFDITNRHIIAVTDQEALFTIPNIIL